jgi:hypothetical protein
MLDFLDNSHHCEITARKAANGTVCTPSAAQQHPCGQWQLPVKQAGMAVFLFAAVYCRVSHAHKKLTFMLLS